MVAVLAGLRRRVFVTALAASGMAHAQDVDVQRFVPTPDGAFLRVEEASVGGDGTAGATVWLDQVDDPLVYRGASGDELRIVGRVATLRGGGFVRSGPVTVGITLPLHLAASGLVGASPAPLAGDATASVKLASPVVPDRLSLGVVARGVLPTGAPRQHLGAGRARVGGAAVGSLAAGPMACTSELGVRSGTGSTVGALPVGPALVWGLGVLAGRDAEVAVSVEAEGERWLGAGDAIGGRPAEWLGAIHGRMGRCRLRVGGGTGLSAGVGAPDWRVVAGLGVTGGKG